MPSRFGYSSRGVLREAAAFRRAALFVSFLGGGDRDRKTMSTARTCALNDDSFSRDNRLRSFRELVTSRVSLCGLRNPAWSLERF